MVSDAMRCPECERLEARIADLRQLHRRASARHLNNPQFNKSQVIAHLEAAMRHFSDAIIGTEERLAKHQQECGSGPPL
jgi:hypothetical protein